jgi:hypothetical protein
VGISTLERVGAILDEEVVSVDAVDPGTAR